MQNGYTNTLNGKPGDAFTNILLQTSGDMFLFFNEELNLVLFNEVADALIKNEGDITGMPFMEVFRDDIKAQWKHSINKLSKEVLKTGQALNFDDMVLYSDNRYLNVETSIAPIDDGEKKGVLITIRDKTELVSAQERAEDAASLKNSLVSNMSREIRTPVNAIKGLSELLSLTKLDSQQRSYVQNIINASNSLVSIINGIVDYTRVDANKIIILGSPYSVADMLQEICNVVNLRMEGKAIQLLVEVPANMPAMLNGDEVRIRQVIINMLSNSIEKINEGFVRLRLFMTYSSGDEPQLNCIVEDNAIPMTQDELIEVFEAYVQPQKARLVTNTDLGLAVCKRLVLAMGGVIFANSVKNGNEFSFKIPQTVVDDKPIASVINPDKKRVLVIGNELLNESLSNMLTSLEVIHECVKDEEGIGSIAGYAYTHCLYEAGSYDKLAEQLKAQMPNCIWTKICSMDSTLSMGSGGGSVLLTPIVIMDLAKHINRQSSEKGSSFDDAEDNEYKFSLTNTKLLVVDDNEINLMVSGEMLGLFGGEIELADSGAKAVELCNDTRYDMIFLDHIMPGMDGLEVTRRLREGGGKNQDTPIVAVTANVENDNMLQYYIDHGMNDLVSKPFEFSDLARVLVNYLPPEKMVF